MNAIDGPPKEPVKKFLWTAEMREVFEQLLQNILAGVELNNKAE
jgi:hypothetical protein